MEHGQDQFFEWILARTQEGKQEELIDLLKENFEQQRTGSFDKAALEESGKRILALIKPEHVEEFKEAMQHFGKGM
ncbi:hypothetical protein BAU15_11615 [Enterococcus sp. JM4C]|uniref:hypothetical protein n=1 Tax=Candidatus Enterococcus huntleyi TaxID=1857217 RepID=UPI0013796011|nr:hypothetical protein [Enterococcus sp. JM4C]KAF1297388.1 hypothetical protein BAU15_11615 [Enterococcus sp. JM4C]